MKHSFMLDILHKILKFHKQTLPARGRGDPQAGKITSSKHISNYMLPVIPREPVDKSFAHDF